MNRLREARKHNEISAEDLAERLEISVPYLYELERGEKRLNEDLLHKIADIFSISTDYILGRTDSPHSPGSDKVKDISYLVPRDAKNHAEAYLKVAETADKYGLTPDQITKLIEHTAAFFGPLYEKEEAKRRKGEFAAHGPRQPGQLSGGIPDEQDKP